MAAGVFEMAAKPNKGTEQSPDGKGVLMRVSKDAAKVARRLSGFLEMPMSDVVSKLILKYGVPELQKLMQDAMDDEMDNNKRDAKK